MVSRFTMKFLSADFPPKRYTPRNYADEESVPTGTVPQPLALSVDCAESLSDLDISSTPEKLGGGSTPWGILKKSEEGSVNGGKRGSRRQVRFHVSCELEERKPDTPSLLMPEMPEEGRDPETPAVQLGHPRTAEDALAVPGGQRVGRQPGRTRLLRAGRQQKKGQRPGQSDAMGSLSSPEYNTSLALGQEMLEAAEKGFDARKAVADQLRKSSVTRQCVDGKVAEGMNIPREKQLFQGLVSLQVPTEDVLSSAVQEKLSLVRPRPDAKKDSSSDGPDLLMFYDPLELFWESPCLGMEVPPSTPRRPRAKPRVSAFDMFRKLQQWEA
ncbi:protein phosphatase 1 regulatory subunit 35 isoform X2 [Rhinatrema bivittatum]|uniref:protein phosphatase 1 regulatory subunit 35 isoform X2 n=1 Tax=Rhinatrema bivittatum TaxID=194408 RepID=UPI001127C1E7|nr:protein phosphatase 1 regulatory subunit 35 isoform X2 [Rhinatrema bivittatum]